MFGNLSRVTHSERPTEEEEAREDDSSRAVVPPRADIVGVADEEGPLPMVLDVKVVVDVDLVVLAGVLLRQSHDKILVPDEIEIRENRIPFRWPPSVRKSMFFGMART